MQKQGFYQIVVYKAATTIGSFHLHPIKPVGNVTRIIRKRKRNPPCEAAKTGIGLSSTMLPMNTSAHYYWQTYNGDEDSSPNDTPLLFVSLTPHNYITKQFNNSFILLNNSLFNNNPGSVVDYNCSSTGLSKPVDVTFRPSLVNGILLHDLAQKCWCLWRSKGKGNFREIFLALTTSTFQN